MNIPDPLLYLGKQADNESVKALLREIGASEYVSIKRNETDTYIENRDLGISLLFESERYVRSKYGRELPTDAPLLKAIFLYGNGDDEYKPFNGEVCQSFRLSNSQQEMRGLFREGKYNDDFNVEVWTLSNGLVVFAYYSDDRKEIASVQLSFRWTN